MSPLSLTFLSLLYFFQPNTSRKRERERKNRILRALSLSIWFFVGIARCWIIRTSLKEFCFFFFSVNYISRQPVRSCGEKPFQSQSAKKRAVCYIVLFNNVIFFFLYRKLKLRRCSQAPVIFQTLITSKNRHLFIHNLNKFT